MDYLLFDIGSSTIKPYLYSHKTLKPLIQKSVHFKKNFIDGNINSSDEKTLIDFIKSIKTKYPKAKIKTYATSVFRDLNSLLKEKLIEKVFTETGVLLNIIDQTTESLYLQLALIGQYKIKSLRFCPASLKSARCVYIQEAN